MNQIILILVTLFFSLSGFSQHKNIVLELFTSQGCSSCPGADRLLKEISENKSLNNIITLSYHVDYWNRLGWRDPFSKASFSNYQQEYGRKFGGRSIYTPQLVVNGKKHIIGSDSNALASSISELQGKKFKVPVAITSVLKKGSNIHIQYKVLYSSQSRLNIVMLLKEKVTEVKRGENKNKTLISTNIVVTKKVVSDPSIREIIFNDVNFTIDELKFVAYVQNQYLEIVGATQW